MQKCDTLTESMVIEHCCIVEECQTHHCVLLTTSHQVLPCFHSCLSRHTVQSIAGITDYEGISSDLQSLCSD